MRRRVLAWLRPGAGLAILGVLLWQLGTEAVVDGLRVIGLRELLLALAIGLATTVLSAWRWCLVARRLGLWLPLGKAVADYYRALLLNALLPAGMLGDVHRAVRHGRQEGDLGLGVRAVVLERAAGQVVLVLAGVAVLLARPAVVPAEFRGLVTTSGVVLVGLAALLLVLALTGGGRGSGGPRWRRVCTAFGAEVRTGLLARDAWPGVAALSVAALAGYLILFLIAARAAGSVAPATQLLPLLVLALLAMGLPVNIGGWGAREGTAALAFGAAGLGAAEGLTTAVVYGVLALVASLPGAGVLLLGRRYGGRVLDPRRAHCARTPVRIGQST
ncbi:lysylphosphatidylglycerol synthase domain-containing protein [Amycolatopsis aidingensis]|uniref:lysylphosphatidylglycerol synthase domain-containing protein n=1 Tax=Amycolatopsis aidingensis TaxID=2842453 RepID=UPI001E5C71BF|nr:lysylphosphatidylglycerol synthase domain-containing protein [Amycolatopsis aidingensis]